MSESVATSVNRVGRASQVTGSYGRTDGRTDIDVSHLPAKSACYVTPGRGNGEADEVVEK